MSRKPASGEPHGDAADPAEGAAPDPLCRLGVVETAAAIKAGTTTTCEVISAHLRRIDDINPGLNAIVRRFDADAIAAAERADEAIRRRAATAPLHGVPVTLKENMDLAGHPTTLGTVALAHADALEDEPVVRRLKAAGAIPIARTNLPDMAMRLHTDSGLHGPTLNPWDRSLTPGGSSGGDAVAVATGMAPLGIGGDMCGSLRWPAQCCGVATLKPTLGAVPRAGLTMAPFGVEIMAVLGPMARSVTDLRAVFAVIAGADPIDPWSYPTPWPAAVELPLAPRRVAMSTDPGGAGVDPSVAAGIERAARELESAGWDVVEAEPPRFDEAARLWPEINLGNPLDIDAMTSMLSPDATAALRIWAEAAGVVPDGATFVGALQRRLSVINEWSRFFHEHGLWLTATATELPFEIGADLESVERVERILSGHRVIMATNSLGLPSVVIPVGVADGVPQSVQIVGPRFAEMACLDAAEVVERGVGTITPIEPVPG